jgi:hypothetical protein
MFPLGFEIKTNLSIMNNNVFEDSSLPKEDKTVVSPSIETASTKTKNADIQTSSEDFLSSDESLAFKGRRLKQKNEQRLKSSSSKSSAQTKEQRVRFENAMAKALPVRRRQLGRKLDRLEWVQLRNAVRKQCTRVNTDSHTKRLEQLEKRVNRLDSSLSADPGVEMADKISLIQLQLNVARQQMMELVSSSQVLTEGCSHVSNKRRINISEKHDLQLQSPGMPCQYLTLSPGSRLLCCGSCLSDRKDLLFETLGSDHSLFKPEESLCQTDLLSVGFYRETTLPSWSEGLHPFQLQEVWVKFLDFKFNR